jgi:sortase B
MSIIISINIKKGDLPMKKIRWDIILIIIAIICFSIYGIISYQNYALKQKAEDVRKELENIINEDTINEDTPLGETDIYISPYENLFQEYPDMIAWLYIPDTNINYPVMYTPDDEEYYLYRDFFGNDDKNGTLFIDTDCSLSYERANIIIHGHHMKSGAMFGSLEKYLDEEYEKEHSYIYLYTSEEMRKYEVISVFESQVYDANSDKFKYYEYFNFDDEETFEEYYENIKKLSVYDTGVEAEFGDEFLTLSTCSYQTEKGRLAVIAKKVKNNG